MEKVGFYLSVSGALDLNFLEIGIYFLVLGLVGNNTRCRCEFALWLTLDVLRWSVYLSVRLLHIGLHLVPPFVSRRHVCSTARVHVQLNVGSLCIWQVIGLTVLKHDVLEMLVWGRGHWLRQDIPRTELLQTTLSLLLRHLHILILLNLYLLFLLILLSYIHRLIYRRRLVRLGCFALEIIVRNVNEWLIGLLLCICTLSEEFKLFVWSWVISLVGGGEVVEARSCSHLHVIFIYDFNLLIVAVRVLVDWLSIATVN